MVRLPRIVRACVVALASLATAGVARADRPAPLSAQTLKAPSGPASLKGLGESFSANPATGTGSYSIPITLPPGFLVPSISLKYLGGTGKGVVGVGFQLPTLQVYRQTDKGAPKFDETDRFAVTGPDYNDELVLVDPVKRLYRTKNEGAFLLFQRDTANDRWVVLYPEGNRAVLGGSVVSRSLASGKTSRWYIDSTRDVFGHQTSYRYFTDQGKVYWQGVDYQQEADVAYRNRVEFVYEARPDVFRDYRYGDLEQTAQRLKTIQVWQGPRLLRQYAFQYQPSTLWSLLAQVQMTGENGLAMPPLSFAYLPLTNRSGRFVKAQGIQTLTGFDTGHMTLEDVNGDGLPDLLNGDSSNYAYYENMDGTRFSDTAISLGVSGSPDRALDGQGVVLADVDGDGYRDVWYPTGDGKFRYWAGGQIANGKFLGYRPFQVMNGNGVVSDVTLPSIRLIDLNGDGKTDLLYQRPGLADVWVENQLAKDLVQRAMPQLPAGVVLGDGSVELLDFNGDGVLDLVQKEFDNGKHDLNVWYGLGSGKYWATAQQWGAPAASAKEIFLTDVNHDGQTDLVRVSGSWVGYYLNDGHGSFAAQSGDFYGMPETSRTRRVLMADMNGNGTTDVVWLTVDGELDYLDLMEQPNVGLLSQIDNGMGLVTNITYRSSTDYMIDAKMSGNRWKTPMPHPVAVISAVSTSDSLERLGVLGWQSLMTYNYADGYYDTKEREFRGFARVTTTEPGDDHQEGQITDQRMHVGRNLDTGADEEALKGKVWLAVIKNERGEVLKSEESKWEQMWLCQEDLGSGAPVVLPTCAGIADKSARKDDLVNLAVETGSLNGAWERQSSPRYTAKKTIYGSWGKPTRVEEYGEVTLPAGHQLGQAWNFSDLSVTAGNDERITETDFANFIDLNASAWLLAFPIESRLRRMDGTIVHRTQTYYDGLPTLGQLSQGLVTRRDSWLAEEARWVTTDRIAYNGNGMIALRTSPMGDTTSIDYDPLTGVLPVTEKVTLDAGKQAIYSATYDRAYGAVTSLTDPNQQVKNFRYDGLGRLVKAIDPTATEDQPSIRYSYQYGSSEHPISTTVVELLSDAASGSYRSRKVFSDGLGRSRLTVGSTENANRCVSTGWQHFSTRGQVTATADAFWSSSCGLEDPPSTAPITTKWLDALGRPLQEQLPATSAHPLVFRKYQYAPFETRKFDERDATEDTLQYPTISQVDGLGRMRTIQKKNVQNGTPVTLNWTLGYDIAGNLVSFADPKGNARSYVYDSLDRLRTLKDPNLGNVSYQYDDAGKLLKRIDALGQQQTNEYGAAGRLKRQVYSKDAHGRPDVEFLYHYDAAQPGGPLATATNLVGQLSYIEYPTGAEHYSYDARGKLEQLAEVLWDGVSPISSQVRTTHYRKSTFNAAGEETHRDLPGGFGLDVRFNARGLVDRMTGGLPDDSRDIVREAVYDERGMVTELEQGNSLRHCQAYDARGQVSGVLLGKTSELTCTQDQFAQSGLGLLHMSYGWGFDGALDSVSDRSQAVAGVPRLDATYSYDRLQQLQSVTSAVGNFAYSYDEIQNLTRRTRQGAINPSVDDILTYGENGAGPNAVTHVGTTTLSYDAIGQLKQYRGYDLTFDVVGRLVDAKRADGKHIEYHYDAWGERKLVITTDASGARRVHRYPFLDYEEHAGDALWRIGAGASDVEVRRAQGLWIDAVLLDELTQYVASPAGKPNPLPVEWMDLNGDGHGFDAADLAVARQAYWDAKPAGGPRGEWRYIARDQLRSSIIATDSNGNTVSSRRYEPYGQLASRTGVQPSHGYTGAEVEPDDDLGLVRMGGRYYAFDLGRWISPDRAIGEQPSKMLERLLESGLYVYVANNPISRADVTGQESVLPEHRAQQAAKEFEKVTNQALQVVGDKYQDMLKSAAASGQLLKEFKVKPISVELPGKAKFEVSVKFTGSINIDNHGKYVLQGTADLEIAFQGPPLANLGGGALRGTVSLSMANLADKPATLSLAVAGMVRWEAGLEAKGAIEAKFVADVGAQVVWKSQYGSNDSQVNFGVFARGAVELKVAYIFSTKNQVAVSAGFTFWKPEVNLFNLLGIGPPQHEFTFSPNPDIGGGCIGCQSHL